MTTDTTPQVVLHNKWPCCGTATRFRLDELKPEPGTVIERTHNGSKKRSCGAKWRITFEACVMPWLANKNGLKMIWERIRE